MASPGEPMEPHPPANADALLGLSPAIRYVAIRLPEELRTTQRPDRAHASSSGSDRYEERVVNPMLLALLSQRGDIDRGGVRAVLVHYGHFVQLVAPLPAGHLSVAIEADANASSIAAIVLDAVRGACRESADGGP